MSRVPLLAGLLLCACASLRPLRTASNPDLELARVLPPIIPTDRPALEELSAGLRARLTTLGLDGIEGPGGETLSRALLLLPRDRSQAGVLSFELEGGPHAGLHQCEALGRGVTSRTHPPGWTRGRIDETDISYAPMDLQDGATIPGVYDLRVISPRTYEIELFDGPGEPESERDIRERVAATAGPKPYYSGVFAHWYSRLNAAMPLDMLWAGGHQAGSQGEGRPVFERRPAAATPEAQGRQARQLSRNPAYYVGPYGRTGFAVHTDRWEDPERLSDPVHAGRPELSDFRFRDTEGCVKVRPACLLLLDEFVSEQASKGRRVQLEVLQTRSLPRPPR